MILFYRTSKNGSLKYYITETEDLAQKFIEKKGFIDAKFLCPPPVEHFNLETKNFSEEFGKLKRYLAALSSGYAIDRVTLILSYEQFSDKVVGKTVKTDLSVCYNSCIKIGIEEPNSKKTWFRGIKITCV